MKGLKEKKNTINEWIELNKSSGNCSDLKRFSVSFCLFISVGFYWDFLFPFFFLFFWCKRDKTSIWWWFYFRRSVNIKFVFIYDRVIRKLFFFFVAWQIDLAFVGGYDIRLVPYAENQKKRAIQNNVRNL